MFTLYQILTILLSPLISLVLLAALFCKKYRGRLPARLGLGLRRGLGPCPVNGKTVWVHALSVGEVTSAGPLLKGLRERWPEHQIVLSVTTASGEKVAWAQFAEFCTIIAAPLDLWPVPRYFIRVIRPAAFIQIETDFWPGWLHQLHRAGVPAYLVNGRITEKSFARYRKIGFFFAPIFDYFTDLCMQTRTDAENLRALGIAPEKIHTLGNLKFDAALPATGPGAAAVNRSALRQAFGFTDAPLLLCGSTHPGEESLLLPAFAKLQREFPGLQLFLAPRQIDRAEELAALAKSLGLPCRRRSQHQPEACPFLLLDTLGELAACYALADLAFIGGSLAPFGGHNPVEAVAAGVPVCFGPHMEDFAEIATEMLQAGGAAQLEPEEALLTTALRALLQDESRRKDMGRKALSWLESRRGVVARHLELLASHLA